MEEELELGEGFRKHDPVGRFDSPIFLSSDIDASISPGFGLGRGCVCVSVCVCVCLCLFGGRVSVSVCL